MNEYLNYALFNERGELVRLVSGSAAQVELNLKNHDGPAFELPLEISQMSDVPPMSELQEAG